MIKKFDYKRALDFGWSNTKNNFGLLIGTSAFSGILVFIAYIIANLTKDNLFTNFIFNIGARLLQTFFIMGFMKIILKTLDWDKPSFIDLFCCVHLIFKYFIASLIYYLIVVIGVIFLFIPGVYLAIKYQFFDYFIIDEECGPIEALNKSAKITDGVKWELLKLGLSNLIINVLGVLFFFIGMIVTIPVTFSARAYAYKKLIAETKEYVLTK